MRGSIRQSGQETTIPSSCHTSHSRQIVPRLIQPGYILRPCSRIPFIAVRIVSASAGACHQVSEVIKFDGTYGRDEWRDLVKSMIVYGAQVTAEEEDILVDYLDTHFGKD